MKLYPKIEETIGSLNPQSISSDRKNTLGLLVDFVQNKIDNMQHVNLNFICTHNSRRSHLAQIWAQTMATYFSVGNVHCFSGGTEATALFPKVVETLKSEGFQIFKENESSNPEYKIKFCDDGQIILGFSKTYDHGSNPQSNFAAVMTCSQADEGCPFIPGAEVRIPITYDDPKFFDNTPQQSEKYKERSLEIATEMFYVFSQIHTKNGN